MSNGGFTLTDTRELGRILDQLEPRLRKRVAKRGLQTAGRKGAAQLRRAAPRRKSDDQYRRDGQSIGVKGRRKKNPTKHPAGSLRRALRYKTLKSGSVVIGLRERFYYETLEFHSARGRPLAPWFEKAMTRIAPGLGQLMVDETKNALAYEAGRTYVLSRRIRRR